MIEILNLNKKYKKNLKILSNINVSFDTKKISLIIGGNGVGKTTLLKVLSDIENFEGKVLYDKKHIHEIGNEIFTVLERGNLYEHLSGLQNIKLSILNGYEIDNWISQIELLDKNKLRKKVNTYSLGERKKLIFMIALLDKSKYLFLDEPSIGLDFYSKKRIRELLYIYSKEKTIIITSHDIAFCDELVDDVFFMENGDISKINEYEKVIGGVKVVFEKYM